MAPTSRGPLRGVGYRYQVVPSTRRLRIGAASHPWTPSSHDPWNTIKREGARLQVAFVPSVRRSRDEGRSAGPHRSGVSLTPGTSSAFPLPARRPTIPVRMTTKGWRVDFSSALAAAIGDDFTPAR
jgi:hypothetical protein